MEDKDWSDLKSQMDSPFGEMKLQCDQYVLSLVQVIDRKSRSWKTFIYVNGVLEGRWLLGEQGEPKHEETRRFMRKESRRIYSAKEVSKVQKVMGKRYAQEIAARSVVMFYPYWSSFMALKKHLVAHNQNIQRIE